MHTKSLTILIILFNLSCQSMQIASNKEMKYTKTEKQQQIMIRFKDGVNEADIQALIKKYNLTIKRKIPRIEIYVLTLKSNNKDETLRLLKREKAVKYVEEDATLRIDQK